VCVGGDFGGRTRWYSVSKNVVRHCGFLQDPYVDLVLGFSLICSAFLVCSVAKLISCRNINIIIVFINLSKV
jgi:hypothetical protein